MIGEVQLWEPTLLEAKNRRGHALYEQARMLEDGDPRAEVLQAEMRSLYGEAFATLSPDWTAAIEGGAGRRPNFASNASADSSRALMPTSAEGTRFQPPSRNNNAAPGAHATGSPSNEPNVQDMTIPSKVERHTDTIESQAPTDVRDTVPIVRDDGSVALVSRADLANVADREKWMAEVISSCSPH